MARRTVIIDSTRAWSAMRCWASTTKSAMRLGSSWHRGASSAGSPRYSPTLPGRSSIAARASGAAGSWVVGGEGRPVAVAGFAWPPPADPPQPASTASTAAAAATRRRRSRFGMAVSLRPQPNVGPAQLGKDIHVEPVCQHDLVDYRVTLFLVPRHRIEPLTIGDLERVNVGNLVENIEPRTGRIGQLQRSCHTMSEVLSAGKVAQVADVMVGHKSTGPGEARFAKSLAVRRGRHVGPHPLGPVVAQQGGQIEFEGGQPREA